MIKPILTCICGNTFEPRRRGGIPQRYCSPRCADRERQRRNRDIINERAKERRSNSHQADINHPRYRPLEERFWEKVEKTDTCWLWTGTKLVSGYPYGLIGVGGTNQLAHRVSYELTYGSISEDINVLHRCDNPICVRPDHLFLGTQRENAQDMVRKGRKRGGMNTADQSGEKNRQAKLTARQVQEIRERYAKDDVYMATLADEYSISLSHVSEIVNRKAWRHLS